MKVLPVKWANEKGLPIKELVKHSPHVPLAAKACALKAVLCSLRVEQSALWYAVGAQHRGKQTSGCLAHHSAQAHNSDPYTNWYHLCRTGVRVLYGNSLDAFN